MNIVAFLNPILSSKIPATLGPMKAPRANVLVHSPLIRPYVSRLFENPYCLKIITVSNYKQHIYKLINTCYDNKYHFTLRSVVYYNICNLHSLSV